MSVVDGPCAGLKKHGGRRVGRKQRGKAAKRIGRCTGRLLGPKQNAQPVERGCIAVGALGLHQRRRIGVEPEPVEILEPPT